MLIEAVIFDIGGVLEANPPAGWPQRWARQLNLEPASLQRTLGGIWPSGSTGACTLEEIERQITVALGLDAKDVQALMGDIWLEYVGTLNHELADYFRQLRPVYKTGILSNSFVGAREREEQAHGFAEMCDVIIYSHEQGYLKPDPRIYHDACDRLDVTPGAAVLLDDVQENVDGAHAVGMQAIRFENNRQAIQDLNTLLGCR